MKLGELIAELKRLEKEHPNGESATIAVNKVDLRTGGTFITDASRVYLHCVTFGDVIVID